MINYAQEYVKCLKDKTRTYFIENYLYTFDATVRKEVPFKLFPRQKAFLKSLSENSNTIAIKHRQAGITTISAAWICGTIVFASKKSPETVLCIANKLDQAVELANKIYTFLMQVPRWMWGNEFYSNDPDSEKNTKSIFIKKNKNYIELFNGCKIYARSSGENAARGISSVSVLIFDEAAFIQNGISVFTSAVAATSAVADSKCIMVSTPNGKDALYYRTYSKALKKENNFHPVEFRWFQDLRYNRNLSWSHKNAETGEIEIIKERVVGSNGEVEYNEDRWKEFEKDGWKPTSPWYENMCKSFNNDEQKIAQELNVSFLGSSDNVIPVETIEMHLNQNVINIPEDWPLKDPFVAETWIWKNPIPGHRYICSCLPAGEQVLTDNGYKNIENITFKDRLYNKDGKLVNIKKIYQIYNNDFIYNIKLKNIINTTKFTSNHPIWSAIEPKKCQHWFTFKYNAASTLSVNDWLEFPNIYRINTLTNNELSKKWEKYDNSGSWNNTNINPLLDHEFWYYCGLWVANGCLKKDKIDNYSIVTTHIPQEKDIENTIIQLFNRLFSFNTYNTILKEKGITVCKFKSKQIGDFLLDTFGNGKDNTLINEWVKHIPEEYKLKLIEGWLVGKECINDSNTLKVISVSKQLLNDMQDIFFSIGIISSIKRKNDEHKIFNSNNICRVPHFILYIKPYHYKKLLERLGINHHISINKHKHECSDCYFSEDYNNIYFQIEKISKRKENCVVYNFETDTHSFCCRYIATHNCDASSGSGEDRTAIEVFDVDAIDDNGFPCIEQVLEYSGKKTNDEIGSMLFQYGQLYNNALVVVEDIGGYGSAAILQLLSLGYPNLYYDDPSLKTYTIQKKYQEYNIKSTDKLPGFHTSSVRFQMISNFVALLKDNSFKVRSIRVINEMETWVFKNGRPDHQDGAHDDTLTCLAMGLFVMQFSMLKNEQTKHKDTTIVQSWFVNNNKISSPQTRLINNANIDMSLTAHTPLYSTPNKPVSTKSTDRLNAMLMLGGFKPLK